MSFFQGMNNCEKLKDGTYHVRHTSNNGSLDYRLTIDGKSCNIKVNDTLNVDGKVKWIDDCTLILELEAAIKQDTTTLARKLYKSFGQPFIKIKETRSDTTFFRTTWSGNLHITINSGYFLRLK